MDKPIVYDKAKYHFESVEQAGLDLEQAYVHTAMFLGWLLDNDLMSDEFAEETEASVRHFKAREKTPVEVYEEWDGCLIDDMLSDEGNAFASAYFDFQRGKYLADYEELLRRGLSTEFSVSFTWDNYAKIAARIQARYEEWRAAMS